MKIQHPMNSLSFSSIVTEHKRNLEKIIHRQLRKHADAPWPKFPDRFIGQLTNATRQEVMCALKEITPNALTRSAFPFNLNPMGKYLPNQKVMMPGRRFKTCGLVSSSGRMSGSGQGSLIGIFTIFRSMKQNIHVLFWYRFIPWR